MATAAWPREAARRVSDEHTLLIAEVVPHSGRARGNLTSMEELVHNSHSSGGADSVPATHESFGGAFRVTPRLPRVAAMGIAAVAVAISAMGPAGSRTPSIRMPVPGPGDLVTPGSTVTMVLRTGPGKSLR
jgi:hypothetical protein